MHFELVGALLLGLGLCFGLPAVLFDGDVSFVGELVDGLHDDHRVNGAIELSVLAAFESLAEEHHLCHVPVAAVAEHHCGELVELFGTELLSAAGPLGKVGELNGEPSGRGLAPVCLFEVSELGCGAGEDLAQVAAVGCLQSGVELTQEPGGVVSPPCEQVNNCRRCRARPGRSERAVA